MPLTTQEIAIPYFDKIITEWGRSCVLIFPEGKQQCPNCIFDTDTNRSSNLYNNTGAEPFPDGEVCPVCLGNGVTGDFTTSTIKLNVVAEPKKWMKKLPPNLNVSEHAIMTTGFMSDLPSVLKSRTIIIAVDLLGINKYQYFLAGEPFDSNHIVQGRYFSAVWDRTSGS